MTPRVGPRRRWSDGRFPRPPKHSPPSLGSVFAGSFRPTRLVGPETFRKKAGHGFVA